MPVTVGGNGSVAGLGAFSFINDAGNANINRPQFMAVATWGTYNHNFNATGNASYTATAGHLAFPAFNNVDGNNTTGFVTSSTPGASYYDIPVTGFYQFVFEILLDSNIEAHTDGTFNVTDAGTNTIRNSYPWSAQYLGQSATTYGAIGFNRRQPAGGQTAIYGSYGMSVVGRFFTGQRIRPSIGVGSNVGNKSLYCANHNFFHGVYLGK